ncbi:hypothetical protein SUGI_0070590 [Cryptomeria japonica]|nr:hypothetical protein SUGI_0070590 [Cryptomeria japonica]
MNRGSNQFVKTVYEYNLSRNVRELNEIETSVHVESNQYMVEVGVGTPPVKSLAIIDTGSDLIWVPCNSYQCKNDNNGCPVKVSCKSPLCKSIPSSCVSGSCKYHYSYGYGNSSSTGILLSETLTFSSGSISDITLGCSYEIHGIPQGVGLIGLGRGPLSLVSQLGSRINHKFSYCLVPNRSGTSHLIFGDLQSSVVSNMKSTPLIQNPVMKRASYYYVGLNGISVGGNLLGLPKGVFDFSPNGRGGLVIDSGSQLTYLDSRAYNPLRNALQSAINLPLADGSKLGLDLCYQLYSNVNAPDITFHFQGRTDYSVPKENYLIQVNNMLCFTMVPSHLGFSIMGSIQQHNFHILYDISKMSLSFAPANCNSM